MGEFTPDSRRHIRKYLECGLAERLASMPKLRRITIILDQHLYSERGRQRTIHRIRDSNSDQQRRLRHVKNAFVEIMANLHTIECLTSCEDGGEVVQYRRTNQGIVVEIWKCYIHYRECPADCENRAKLRKVKVIKEADTPAKSEDERQEEEMGEEDDVDDMNMSMDQSED